MGPSVKHTKPSSQGRRNKYADRSRRNGRRRVASSALGQFQVEWKRLAALLPSLPLDGGGPAPGSNPRAEGVKVWGRRRWFSWLPPTPNPSSPGGGEQTGSDVHTGLLGLPSQARARMLSASLWNCTAPSFTLVRPKATASATRSSSFSISPAPFRWRRRQRNRDLSDGRHVVDLHLAEFVELRCQESLRCCRARHAALDAERLHAIWLVDKELDDLAASSVALLLAEMLMSIAGLM